MGIASLETLIAPDVITAKYIKFAEDDLSGNYIKGGIITDFSSTGIIDQATKQTLHLDDEGLSVDNIYTNNVDASKIAVRDMTVTNKLTVHNLKHVFTEAEFETNLYMQRSNTINMGRDVVLSRNELGPGVAYSNLRRVGNLEKLVVMGDLTGGYGTIHVNTLDSRIGINTTEPIATLHVITDAGAELIVDGHKNHSYIGTARKTSLHFGTSALETDKSVQLTLTTDGNLGIGTREPTTKLEVVGDIKFSGIRMSTAKSVPTTGHHMRGDIVWNLEPRAEAPTGWVCIKAGMPGEWGEFGTIYPCPKVKG